MANWEQNQVLYTAKLEAVIYLCNNWWRFKLSDETGEKRVVTFTYPYYASMPEEIVSQLRPRHLRNIEEVANAWFLNAEPLQSYTVDDLLYDLDWHFNPEDVKDLKMQYKEPQYKKRKGKK